MADNNFPAIQIGGGMLDFDDLHGKVDAGTLTSITNEVVTIDYSHEKIHDSLFFHAGRYFGTIDDGGTAYISLAAGTVTPHVTWAISCGGNTEATFTEGGTITGGTAVTVFNRARDNAGSCLSTVNHSGTLTGGTIFYDVLIAGGQGPKPAGGQTRDNNEWILKKSKTTTLKLVNVSGAAYACSIGMDWYEEAT